ncbi:hypothetical protein B1991_08715 [Rhodanobacter lindaniclasticus]|jgi:hypothetical protein|uniref:Copper resistance protein n=2 Tax=Rhodanobacter lindaniclasticus TaxID=75310 RepID=A0A4S3KFV0_9GAMM|nr:hypothetical protein B1991_08715 [Rhodanobacter lindaniclasticus]
MAWLAWLILALAPVHGMPRLMADDAMQGAPVSSVTHTAEHGQHAMPAASDCCADHLPGQHDGMASAHCAAACGSMLPAVALVALVPVAPEPLHVSPPFAAAPSVVHATPLRPPAG